MNEPVESVLQKLAEELAKMWPVNGNCWTDCDRILKERSGNIMVKLRSALDPMLAERENQCDKCGNMIYDGHWSLRCHKPECDPEAEIEKLRELLRRWRVFAPNCAQLLDGWHQDGTAWSEWDESVRKELTEIQIATEQALSPSPTPAQCDVCGATVELPNELCTDCKGARQ